MQINSSNYLQLADIFYEKQKLVAPKKPSLIHFNAKLGKKLNLANLDKDQIIKIFSGQDKKLKPLSLIYAGHQFGHFVPRLGDGRAAIIGQVSNNKKEHYDILLKGSGKTKFSRSGDGKYPLPPALKEYIFSEALHYLKIPTTRSLCLIATNEAVFREEINPGAILTRVAKSHIRFGTFEYFAFNNNLKNIKKLADFCLQNYYPNLVNKENPYLEFFKIIYQKQIDLVASWMSYGFIHGVMNTDNCLISAESIDFGPCAFMEKFNFNQCYSYIDQNSRYCYSNQKPVILWNLIKFGETLLPLINDDINKSVEIIEKIISNFSADFDKKYYQKMLRKIGLKKDNKNNRLMLDEFLNILQKNQLDFTNSFRDLSDLLLDNKISNNRQIAAFINKLQNLIAAESNLEKTAKNLNNINPKVIVRNHIIKKISDNFIEKNDDSLFLEFLKILENPFSTKKVNDFYTNLPKKEEEVRNTFCGT